jgi:hypothetical protein
MSPRPIIFDFDAIGQRISAADDQPSSLTTTLVDLIAEEKRAWDAHTPVCREADLHYFAWRAANPALDKEIEDEKDLPAPMGELYRQAEALRAAASDLTDRICAWIPATLSEAVTLLEWQDAKGIEDPRLAESLLSGLRAIAARAGSPTDAQPRPIDGADEFVRPVS